MKIVDQAEALETVRKPPFRELSENYEKSWPHVFVLVRPGRCTDITGLPSVPAAGLFSVPHASSALLQDELCSSGPVSGDRHGAGRKSSGCVSSKGTGEEETVCFRIQLCFVHETLSDCAEIPCLTLTLGQSALYTSTNTTVAVFTVHTVSIGTVYKDSYMKNNINMFNL